MALLDAGEAASAFEVGFAAGKDAVADGVVVVQPG